MKFEGLVRRQLFWINDKLYNHSLVKMQYDEIMDALSEKRNLADVWLKQREKIATHAAETCKFYSEYIGKSFEKFPVINKKVCIEKYDDFVSDIYINQKLHKMSTNGSTGTPFTILQDIGKRSRVIAELKAFMAVCGLLPNGKMIYLDALSARKESKSYYTQWRENIWRADISNLGRVNAESVIRFMERHQGKVVLGFPSTMEWLANYCANDSRLKELNVKTVVTAGEMLHSETRRKAKNLFGNQCNILSRYSNQEMGILGQEKKEMGPYLLNHSSYYFECLKIGEDEPVEEGEVGRIVITDLYNYAFPLIRYDTEDLGIMGRDKDISIYPVLTTLYGKKRDVLYNSKREPVFANVIDGMFYGRENIKQWKLVQEDYTLLRLYIVCNEDGKQEVDVICRMLKIQFGEGIVIVVEYVDGIADEKGGKYSYIICKIPNAAKK